MAWENMISINYNSSYLEYCMFINEKFVVDKILSDTKQCDMGISLIRRYEIKKVILSTSCNIRIYKMYKLVDIDISLMDQKYFNSKLNNKKREFNVAYNCLNALISYIEIFVLKQHIGQLYIEPGDKNIIGHIGKYTIEMSNTNTYLYIDAQTILDLRLETEIFNMLNFTKTVYGKVKLMSIIKFPLKNKSYILKRHRMIEEIRNIHVTANLKHMKSLNEDEILEVFNVPLFLLNAIQIAKSLNGTSLAFKNISKFRDLYEQINIFESNDLKRGIFPKYDRLVNMYVNLPDYLGKILNKMVKNDRSDLNIVYLPQLGYLVEIGQPKNIDKLELVDFLNSHVKNKKYELYESINQTNNFCESVKISDQTTRSLFPSTLNFAPNVILQTQRCLVEENTRFRFVLSGKMYIKTNIMVKLDQELGDVVNLIHEYKEEKINETRDLIQKYNIGEICDYIGLVDCINSLLTYSNKYNCKPPVYTEIRKISFINFYEYRCNIQITSNCICNSDSKFLRIVGQMVLLAQIGSYLPCKYSELCLFDKLYTSIDIEESLVNNTSYFLASVKSINRIVRDATENSLCLISELGYGTNYYDGMRLFYAVHRNLIRSFIVSTCLYKEIFKHNHCVVNCDDLTVKPVDALSTPIIDNKHLGINEKILTIKENMPDECVKNNQEMTQRVLCLCTWYLYVNIKFKNSEIIFNQKLSIIKDIRSEINNLDLSKEFKGALIENYNKLNHGTHLPIILDDTWARQVVSEFIRKYKNVPVFDEEDIMSNLI